MHLAWTRSKPASLLDSKRTWQLIEQWHFPFGASVQILPIDTRSIIQLHRRDPWIVESLCADRSPRPRLKCENPAPFPEQGFHI